MANCYILMRMIAIIAAVAENGIIGANNKLPWHLPADLKRFKELTTGKVVIMGRKTYESILTTLGSPLPNRKNIVITRNTNYKTAEGVDVFYNIEEALKANESNDIFIIGGGEIFKQSVDLADTLYITHIHKTYEGDAHFPKVNMSEWKIVNEDTRDDFTFSEYKKIK